MLIELPNGLTDPIEIAMYEFERRAIPITVVRKLPGERRGTTPVGA